jgi:hypothetical protein
MPATIFLPAVTAAARHAAGVRTTWDADPEMPSVEGCAEDAVRVLAVRAAVHAATGDERLAALAAPAAVELTGLVLAAQLPELRAVIERAGYAVIHGEQGARWEPGDYLHQVYVAAFGPVTGRHWPV